MSQSITSISTITPAVTVSQFRGLFPEFDDSSVYLDEWIEPWLQIATQQLDPVRWGGGAMYAMGIGLFAAHELVLQRQATIAAQRGGIPGLGVGVAQSKSINGVSVSYNTGISTITNAGDWNLTTYGVRFIQFARMFGSGGTQVVGSDAGFTTEAQLIQGNIFPSF